MPAGAEYKRSLRLIAPIILWPNFIFASLQDSTTFFLFIFQFKRLQNVNILPFKEEKKR